MKKKAVFFDIDGTLWDRQNYIPESTRTAIKKLRECGHLTFICTGRSRGYVQDPGLLELGFDGIVSGCGTMIEYHGEIIFDHTIEPELVEHTVRTVRKYGMRPILEGKEYLYLDESEFGEDAYGKKLKKELGERRRSIEEAGGNRDICKLSCATEDADCASCFRELEPYYDYIIHNSAVVEMVPKGFHKGTGIAKVCELLNMERSDTIAIGDSMNDLGMFEAAGIAVAMGNGTEEAKAAADHITTELLEDGIWNACLWLGLIKCD